MSSIIQRLHERDLITPPHHVLSGMQYETIMGSVAYGVADTNEKSMSDVDVYGFSIPFKDMVFPHAAGNVVGFGRQTKKFEQYQQHHIYDKSSKKEYDFSVYNIVKYFQLCMDNNPNIVDSLFTPVRCVLYCSQIGNYVRENRKLFLHKGAWFKFKGYAYSQLYKLKNKKILEFINLCKE
jgi:predicted nucleotidyltransferase